MKPLRALGLSLLLALGCGGERVAAPPPRAPLTQASDAIPADLDVVVRIDLGRVRAALGPELVAQARRATAIAGGDGAQVLAEAFERAEVAVVGFTPRSSAALDHVLVLEGNFERFDPTTAGAEPRWLHADDIGADIRRWDRSRSPARDAPARIYAYGERLLVVASSAEVDSTERAVEEGQRGSALTPPNKGVVSFAARVLPLALALQSRSPKLAEWLRAAERIEGSAEIASDGVRLELALKADSPEAAEQLRPLLQAVTDLLSLKSSLREILESAKFETAGTYVVCRLELPRDALGRWLACAGGDSPCTW